MPTEITLEFEISLNFNRVVSFVRTFDNPDSFPYERVESLQVGSNWLYNVLWKCCVDNLLHFSSLGWNLLCNRTFVLLRSSIYSSACLILITHWLTLSHNEMSCHHFSSNWKIEIETMRFPFDSSIMLHAFVWIPFGPISPSFFSTNILISFKITNRKLNSNRFESILYVNYCINNIWILKRCGHGWTIQFDSSHLATITLHLPNRAVQVRRYSTTRTPPWTNS